MLIYDKANEKYCICNSQSVGQSFNFALLRDSERKFWRASGLARNNDWYRITIHLAEARLLTNCHKSVNCFKGKLRRVQVAVSLIGWTTRDLYRFIPNAFNFSVDSPVGKSASAETFKSLHCYPGKGITLFLDGSLVLFLGSERGFEQMWEFRLCKTINCFGCQVKLGTRAFCCFTNEPVFLLH